MRRPIPVLAAAVCACALAAAALADPIASVIQPDGPAGCITSDGTSNGAAGQCGDGRGIAGAEAIMLSPDGKFAYDYSYDSGAVAMLTRDASTGALSEADDVSACLAHTGVGGDCTDGRLPGTGSDTAHALAVSGGHVFVAGSGGSSISVFNRNITTGALSEPAGPDACISQNGADSDSTPSSCLTYASLSAPMSLAVSPDGRFLYAGGFSSVGITAYSIDQTTGALTPLGDLGGCYSATSILGCTQARFTAQIYDIAMSPDGSTLYAADLDDNAVVAFTRNGTTGALTQVSGTAGCIVNGGVGDVGDPCTQGHGLDGPQSVEVSPDGHLVVVGAATAKGLAILHRGAGGGLSQSAGATGCVNETAVDDCGTSRKTQNVYRTLFAGDSATLYVAGYGDDTSTATSVATSGISLFDVGSDGTLTQRGGTGGCINDTGVGGCMVARGVLGPVGLALSGDGRSLYVASYSDNGIAHFRVQHAPACADASATTAFGTPKAIPVTCTDSDGDTLTLAGVDGPGHGSVAFSGLTATYTPAAGFSGDDTFRVKGNDGANDSAPATVTVHVAAAPPPAGKKAPLKLSIAAKPKRDKKLPFKFTLSGKLTPAAGTTCSGKVVVTVKRAKKTVAKKTAKLSAACKYKAVVKFSNRKKLGKKKKGKLTAKARYGGNAAMTAKSSKALTVRFG